MQLLRYNDLNATPWKNGGGITREIARWPAGATLDGFDWRVSVADVSASGQFSVFPGVERIITLLDGEGMYLQFENGKRHSLTEALAPYRFRGEASVYAQLAEGPSRDFNLMFCRERIEGEVSIWRSANTLTSGYVLLYCSAGSWEVDEHVLHAGDSLLADPADSADGPGIPGGTAMQPAQSGSALIGVRIEPHSQGHA